MNQLGTVYATKRRRRNGKSLKPPPKDGVTKSNPSKRHRERLNAELDTLASLLPFEQNILSKLDRLSILRLSVSYLRTKSYFQVVMHKDKEDGLHHEPTSFRNREMAAYDHAMLDGEMFLQALNGFLLILTCEGEVFFATHSIESYLGFHQSDIVHQSVYELVHSEDREELQRQLMWNSFLAPEGTGLALQDVLRPEHTHLLERSFTVRFRCLLDNTSGFLRLDIRGRVKVLHGQNRKTEEPPLALFAICTPFGPPSLLEIPQKEVMFKSKHKLDLALVSMDQRGKLLLGYSDAELANLGGYDLVHYDDLAYVASAHQELLKTGASGMIAYRFQTKEGGWQWLQTSSRLVYKNSKPDFVISTHRPLMEEEGRDLLGKRTMDFKVSYLDAGLTNSYFADSDPLVMGSSPLHHSSSSPSGAASGGGGSGGGGGGGGAGGAGTPQRVNRRYKTQLRDFLSTCRTKRKLAAAVAGHPAGAAAGAAVAAAAITNSMAAVDYISAATSDTSSAAAAAVAAAYNMYSTPYASSGVSASAVPDNGLSSYMGHSAGNFHQSLYPAAALDNRFLTTTENLFHQYRPLGSYYTEYHHAAATTPYVSNGFLDMSPRGTACTLPTYDTSATTATSHHHMHHQLTKSADDKLYSCQQLVDTGAGKYAAVVDGSRGYVVATGLGAGKCLDVSAPYSVSPSAVTLQPLVMASSPDLGAKSGPLKQTSKQSPSVDGLSSHSAGSSPAAGAAANGLVTPKLEDIKPEVGLMSSGSPPGSHHLGGHHLVQGLAPQQHYVAPASSATDAPRQTVLMWGSGGTTTLNHTPGGRSPAPVDAGSNDAKSLANGAYGVGASPKKYANPPGPDPLKSLAEMNSLAPSSTTPASTATTSAACKWAGGGVVAAKSEPSHPPPAPPPASPHPASPSVQGKGAYQQQHAGHTAHHSVFHPPAPPPPHHPASHHHQHLSAAYCGDAAATAPSSTFSSSGGAAPAPSEVWNSVHHHHQYHHQYYPYTTPYHHQAPHSTPVSDTGYPQISRTGVLCCPSLR